APADASPLRLEEIGAGTFSGPYAPFERRVARFHADIEGGAAAGQAHASLIETLERWRRAVEQAEGADGAEQLADLDRQIRAATDDWIRRRPAEIDGYLALLRAADGAEEHSAALARIEERFGDSWTPLEAVAEELRQRDDLAGAMALAERHLARRPDDAGAYASLVTDLREQDAYRRAADVARRWLERRPDDIEARRHVLVLSRFELSEKETAELAASILSATPGAPDGELCLDFETAGAAASAAGCWLRLAAALPEDDLPNFARHFLRSMARSLAASGQVAELAAVADGAPLGWRRNFVDVLGDEGLCAALEGFIASAGPPEDPSAPDVYYFRQTRLEAMVSCGLAAAGDEALALLREGDPRSLQNLAHDRYLRGVSLDRVEDLLLERLSADPGDDQLQQALASFYRTAGEPEKLLGHAVDWASHLPASPEPAILAAEGLVAAGHLDAARPWIDELLRRQDAPDWRTYRAGQLLIQLDELGRVRELAETMVTADSSHTRASGLRLSAQVDGLEGVVDNTFEALEAHNDASDRDKRVHADQMRSAGRLGELVAAVEADVRADASESAHLFHRLLAFELAAFGLWAEAEQAYRTAIEASPDDIALRLGRAAALEKLGRVEGAFQMFE
ncbi:MAG: hypothetical protein AAFY88_16980, partial [Acidobacteriota bacterium]